MSQDLEIIKAETTDTVKLTYVPYLKIRLNGSSYINKKAVSLLGVSHGDTVSFYHTKDFSKWWLGNDPNGGATVQKDSGLMKFSDKINVSKLLSAWGIAATTTVTFILAEQLENISQDQQALFIVPKPINLK